MKLATTISAAAGVFFASQAAAQDVPETVPADPPETVEDMSDNDPVPEVQRAFTDAEVAAYVAAAMRIRTLRDDPAMDDAARMAAAETIVGEEGLDAQTYTAIGRAAQTDPALAQRIQAEADRVTAQNED